MPDARYWRFRPLQTPGHNDLIMMNRIEAYDASGAVDYMQTATVTSASPQDGSLANLLDTDDNSYCQFHQGSCWVMLDVGSGNTVELDHYKFKGGGAGNYISRSPGTVLIETSDNGTDFVVVGFWYGMDIPGVDQTTYRTAYVPPSLSTPAWWGILINGSTRGPMSIAALQMFDDAASSTNLALSVTNPTAYDSYSGSYVPAYAFDNDSGTFWSSGSNGPGFLFAQLSSAAVIEKIGVQTRNDDFGAADAPLSGFVMASEDGENWLAYWTYTFSGWSNGQTKTYSNPDPGTIGGGGGILETVGSASAVATATGVLLEVGVSATKGQAAAVATATGVARSLGINSMVGSASALGTALGASDPIRPTVAAGSAVSLATGRMVALGTISTVGTASATSNADSGSAATGIIASVGTASAVSSANADSSGRIETVGTASAASSANAVGSYKPSEIVARASATSLVLGVGNGIQVSVGTAKATSEALGKLAGVRSMVGAAAGQGSGIAVTNANTPTVGAGSASSSAAGIAMAIIPTIGAGSATSTAQAVSTGLGAMEGHSVAISMALGRSLRVMGTVGVAIAISEALGKPVATVATMGAAGATSSAAGVTRAFQPTRGSASATSSGNGVTAARSPTKGYALAHSLATGIMTAKTPGLDPDEIIVLDGDEWLLVMEPPGDELLIVELDQEIVVIPFDGAAALAA